MSPWRVKGDPPRGREYSDIDSGRSNKTTRRSNKRLKLEIFKTPQNRRWVLSP